MALQIFHPCHTGAITSFSPNLTVNLTADSRNGTEGIGVKFQWQCKDSLNFDDIERIGLNFDGIEGIYSTTSFAWAVIRICDASADCRVGNQYTCVNSWWEAIFLLTLVRRGKKRVSPLIYLDFSRSILSLRAQLCLTTSSGTYGASSPPQEGRHEFYHFV